MYLSNPACVLVLDAFFFTNIRVLMVMSAAATVTMMVMVMNKSPSRGYNPTFCGKLWEVWTEWTSICHVQCVLCVWCSACMIWSVSTSSIISTYFHCSNSCCHTPSAISASEHSTVVHTRITRFALIFHKILSCSPSFCIVCHWNMSETRLRLMCKYTQSISI